MTLEELTTRVRIRNAALKHFAEEGYDKATIRAIAQTAGVSHGMLRHHYGSKDALRAMCDEYVFKVLVRLTSLTIGAPATAHSSQRSALLLWSYAARSLAEGSATAAPIFDLMVSIIERVLHQSDNIDRRSTPAATHIWAILLTAMVNGIPLLHDQLSRTLEIDIFAPEGHTLIMSMLHEVFASRPPQDTTGAASLPDKLAHPTS